MNGRFVLWLAALRWVAMLGMMFLLLATLFWLDGYHIVRKPTPDQLYGCTVQQQAPNGECQ